VATQLLSRERNLILVSLIALAIAAWVIVIWQADSMDTSLSMSISDAPQLNSGSDAMAPATTSSMGTEQASMDAIPEVGMDAPSSAMVGMNMGLTMNMSAALFLGVWIAMMVAMMFPTAAPMILSFARIQGSREAKGQVFVPTWLFILAYLALWSAMGIFAFLGASAADGLAENSEWVLANAGRIGGAILVIAGLYQLSPWKNRCLAQCRTPMGFIMSRWQEGRFGAVRMGFEHGTYCLGCCWFLFVILFPLGMMNVAALTLITLLIFAEKSLAIGERVARFAAVGLIGYGTLVLVALPSALPTSMTI